MSTLGQKQIYWGKAHTLNEPMFSGEGTVRKEYNLVSSLTRNSIKSLHQGLPFTQIKEFKTKRKIFFSYLYY